MKHEYRRVPSARSWDLGIHYPFGAQAPSATPQVVADNYLSLAHNKRMHNDQRTGTFYSLPGSPATWGPQRAISARWGEGTGLRRWGGYSLFPVFALCFPFYLFYLLGLSPVYSTKNIPSPPRVHFTVSSPRILQIIS
jgi:hypothetical protein